MIPLHSIAPRDAADFDAFVRDALQADWACYTAPEDRVEADRLARVIGAFPDGFRVYYRDGRPVGYTGWYPVPRDIFERLHNQPETLTHRGQISSLPALSTGGDYLYLFNYSIIPALHKSEASRSLLKSFAYAVNATPHKGFAAVTVSPDGARVAQRFGMAYRGDMTHDGAKEGVYTLKLL